MSVVPTSPKPRRKAPEQVLHQQIASFLNVALAGNSWWSTMPLGGGGRMRGGILRRLGTKAGLPDILVINDGRAIFFELKAPKGRLSDVQFYCHAGLRKAHAPVYEVRELGDMVTALTKAGVPLKASLTI